MKFRFHRGGFDMSMSTVVEVHSTAELAALIKTELDCEISNVHIAHYSYDSRNDWDTYIVTVDTPYGNVPVGFTDGTLIS